ncbi:hypothetical protein [Streptomyces sp. NPDC050428]|uniref:hypothetical protein n=1 Tax=Streptomyces sp. NPDC050428 TaxID=3155757 RepID=UPI00341F1A91
MSAEQGYQVATTRMSQPAGELDGSGDDAEKIRKAIDPTMCYTQSQLGGSDSAAAFNEFAAAWVADTATLRDALHELANKVRLAKGAYSGSDQLVETQTSGVRVGGSSPTTMPAYADRPSALSEY